MAQSGIKKTFLKALREYRDDLRGALSVELVFALPLLLWAYLAMLIFADAYRAQMQAQAAALHVADLVSRNTQVMTTNYLEGMNDVFDFLSTRNLQTRLRISSIMWDFDTDQPAVVWSYGTRNLPPLANVISDTSFEIADAGDESDEDDASWGFSNAQLQLPIANLVNRIPPVLPGEALILVESISLWQSPIISWMGFDYLNNIRMTPIAVTRPRFSPFIRYEHDNEIFPEGPPEYQPTTGEPEAPVEEEEDEPEPPSSTVTIVDTDFNDGDTTNWSSNTVTHTVSNSFFGPFGRETRDNPVTYQVDLGAQSSSARIEFELFIIDSWDGFNTQWANPEGEHLMIQVNGTSIALEAFQHGASGLMRNNRRTVASRAEGQFTTTMELIQHGTDLWGSHWSDQIWRVVIEVENPEQTFTLGFSANLDEEISNESFGFRDFRVIAERGDHGPEQFAPNAGARRGEDAFTRFTSYSGCPVHQIPAQHLRAYNSDLTNTVRVRRTSDGATNIGNCGIPGAANFNTASPTLVLDYDNNTPDVNGNRLRIQTDDGNNGQNCDATLLVRGPYGEWSFNSEISWVTGNNNFNARLSMGHPASGEYHIWMGTWNNSSCETDLIISRY